MRIIDIIKFYNDLERSDIEAAQSEIIEIKRKLHEKQERHEQYRQKARPIVDTLRRFGLQVHSVAGNSVYAVPIPGNKRFRFIKFRGYTGRGNSLNDSALERKAETIQDALAAAGVNARVNECSLEYRDEKQLECRRVIIDIFLACAPDASPQEVGRTHREGSRRNHCTQEPDSRHAHASV